MFNKWVFGALCARTLLCAHLLFWRKSVKNSSLGENPRRCIWRWLCKSKCFLVRLQQRTIPSHSSLSNPFVIPPSLFPLSPIPLFFSSSDWLLLHDTINKAFLHHRYIHTYFHRVCRTNLTLKYIFHSGREISLTCVGKDILPLLCDSAILLA